MDENASIKSGRAVSGNFDNPNRMSQAMKQNKSIKTLHTIINIEQKRWKDRQSKMLQKRESQRINLSEADKPGERSQSMISS